MKLIRLVCATGVVLVSGGCAKHLAAPPVAPERVAVQRVVVQSSTDVPLILVDGRVTDSAGMNRIAPSRIESVEVLKGAAAIERYGSRAESGAIVITLKQAPLILVDGRVTDSAEMNQIDPSHIDRVEVLKGAAAVERYGAGAVNGVILITLKQAI